MNIFYSWLLIWCGTFAAQDALEQEFLVLQAISVINKMTANESKREENLFRYILLMLQVVFVSVKDKDKLLFYLAELWKIDLELPNC